MVSINNRSDLSKIFDIIEDSIIQNTYMKQKLTDSKANVEQRSQKVLEQKKERERESERENAQESVREVKVRNKEKTEIKKEVSRVRLQEAIVWAEILGQPMCKRRRSKMSRYKYRF